MPRYAALATAPLQHLLQICTFVFNNFQDAPPATPFVSCFCIVARGWGTPSPRLRLAHHCFSPFALGYPLYFHANTNCPFCNSFVLITIRIARGWVGAQPIPGIRYYLKSPAWRATPLFSVHSVISVLRKHRCPHSNLSAVNQSSRRHRACQPRPVLGSLQCGVIRRWEERSSRFSSFGFRVSEAKLVPMRLLPHPTPEAQTSRLGESRPGKEYDVGR